MLRHFSIQRKLLFPIVFGLSIVLLCIGFLGVTFLHHLVQRHVEAEAMALIRQNATEITDFFVERSRVVQTFFHNPFFLDFFSRYAERGKPIQNSSEYQKVVEYFREILKADSTIESIFFATEATGEYFDEEGRYENPTYSAKTRAWWKNTLAQGRLYCARPDFDYADSTISSSMEMPIFFNGRFLGIGGIDILITTIGEQIQNMQYKGHGQAFLVDDQGHLIFFPGIPVEKSIQMPISALDEKSRGGAGFKELASEMQNKQEGMKEVQWKGETHEVLYSSISSDIPFIHWKLGILVPEDVISGPVKKVTILSIFTGLLALLSMLVLMGFIITRTVRPLDALANRLDTMANREADLTEELPVETEDVIGRTAGNFNQLIGRIRGILIRVVAYSRDLVERVGHLHQQSESIAEEAKGMAEQAKLVAGASAQIMKSVEKIGQSMGEVDLISKKLNEASIQGESLVGEQNQRMKALSQQVETMAKAKEHFKSISEEVAHAVEIIEDVSEQIRLLAINASIETVRAGKSGTAFSAVVEEIRRLSEHTAEVDQKIAKVIQRFQKELDTFFGEIESMRNRILSEFEFSEAVHSVFETALETVDTTVKVIGDIQTQTQEQATALEGIDKSLQDISKATQKIANGVHASFAELTEINKNMIELHQAVGTFKVE